jgi:Cys-rich repeat protein
MLKRLKIINLMVMASLMLVFTFSAFDKAKAQGLTACPGVPFDTGWFQLNVFFPFDDVKVGLLGTAEATGAGFIGGIDWLYTDSSLFNTQLSGSQLVSWWTQAPGRNTSIQVTNADPFLAVNLHVVIIGSDCLEVRNFCDTLTPLDTHVYDFGNLVTNLGQDIPEGNIQGDEGFVVISAVDFCPNPNTAIIFNSLEGQLSVIDSALDIDYGTNLWARLAVTFDGGFSETGTSLDGVNAGYIGPDFDPVFATDLLFQNFAVLGAGPAGADLVLINYEDFYGPPYDPVPFSETYTPGIFDEFENFVSCGEQFSCGFLRLGIDDAIVNSDDLAPVIPTPTPEPPTPCFSDEDCALNEFCAGGVVGACDVSGDPCTSDTDCPEGEICEGAVAGTCELIPCTSDADCPEGTVCDVEGGFCVIPTPTPTPPPDGGDGGGCAIAGPVSVGTAMANILIPLVPVAFAFGLSALRRRNRKNNK